MTTFQREISFLALSFNESDNTWTDQPVTKIATFAELNRRDKKQHKLHFAIVSLFSKSTGSTEDDGERKVNLDSDEIYDMSVRAIKDLLIVDDQFSEADKKEFLSDSGAIIDFGFWLMSEKVIPFFQILMKKQSG